MLAHHGMNFFRRNSNGAKTGFEPVTTWSSEAFITRLLLYSKSCLNSNSNLSLNSIFSEFTPNITQIQTQVQV
jgi:hypothetical protein